MPHYSDLYSLPSPSGLCLPHYNSGLNFLSYSKPVTRYPHLYKPHLSTISEISLPYRRLNTPKLYTSDLSSRPIKVINTADIDVSVNKYKKFEKKGQQRFKAKELAYIPEPAPAPIVKEAKPQTAIRRDRATVRLRTLHTDTLKEEIGAFKKNWRDNFEPEELTNETRTKKKTKGELLKEKFLIRSRSKENIQALAIENKKKNLVRKTSSFREICDAITCDNIDDEELNPGQPEEIKRRQSKQLSSENLFNEIRRVSTELTPEDLKVLNVMLSSQTSSLDSSDDSMTLYEIEEIATLPKSERVQKESVQTSSTVEEQPNSTINRELEDLQPSNPEKVTPTDTTINIVSDKKVDRKIKEAPNKLKVKTNLQSEKLKIPIIKDRDENEINKNLFKTTFETKTSDNKAKIDSLKKQIESGKLKQQNNLQANILKDKEKESTSKESKISSSTEVDEPNTNQSRDISNVEIEQIKFKPKPVITGSVDEIIVPKKTLIAVVDEVVEEKPNKNKDKKLKFNVSVNIEQVKKKEGSKNRAISRSIKRGTAFHPVPQKTLLNNLVIHKPKLYEHKQLKELKLKKKHKIKETIQEEAKDTKESEKVDVKHNIEEFETSDLDKNKEPDINPSKKICDTRSSIITNMPPKLTSKRSLIQKPIKDDPDLTVFVPPPTPEPEPEPEKPKDVFVPLQSNRLSQWMHPWAKPEQYDACPVEIYARPKVIRGRHYPRGRKRNIPFQPISASVENDSDSEEDSSSEETSASLRSNDSGFGSTIPEKLTANPENQQAESAESETVNQEVEDFLTAVKNCGRIIPPATTIPRFKKYNVDDFDFLKVLGKGSFGKVLLSKLKDTEYYYAVKCLKKDAIVEDDDVECTLIERKVLALGTKHPFLCHLLCTFQTQSHLFFVMEYLNGGDLMFHITTGGCFPEDQARFYSAEVISGLQFLHSKGIIYRDLKLDNIILDFDGHVRLADFGMCKLEIFLDRMAESFCGTPDYMAPEIIKGLHYNQAVDWWSFGVLLYEMLLGQSPFSGCDEDELFWSICNEKPVFPKHLSTYAVDILTVLMEKDQTKRLGNRFCEHGPIREHRFYNSIDWNALEARQIEPPFKPDLVHPLDTQYFDTHFTKEAVKLTATEVPVLETIDQSQFQGFSYTNPNACDK